MHKVIAILFFLLAAAAVVFLFLYPKFKQESEKPKVTNFEECAAAGYPVMESYPRQCSVPSGKFFVEQVLPAR